MNIPALNFGLNCSAGGLVAYAYSVYSLVTYTLYNHYTYSYSYSYYPTSRLRTPALAHPYPVAYPVACLPDVRAAC